MWYNRTSLCMVCKTVRWGIGVAVIGIWLHISSPTAFADTILEIPRSDSRLFCSNTLTSPAIMPLEASQAPLPTQVGAEEKPTYSLNPDVLFNIINNYRASIGLPSFQKDQAICDIARQRGPALDHEVETGTVHAGFYALNLPYWATENVKYGGNEQEMFNWWMNSYIHRKAIEGDFTYSCGECYGKSCNQIFTNYQAK